MFPRIGAIAERVCGERKRQGVERRECKEGERREEWMAH